MQENSVSVWQYLKDYGVVEAILAIFTIVVGIAAIFRGNQDKRSGNTGTLGMPINGGATPNWALYGPVHDTMSIIREMYDEVRELNRVHTRMEGLLKDMVTAQHTQTDVILKDSREQREYQTAAIGRELQEHTKYLEAIKNSGIGSSKLVEEILISTRENRDWQNYHKKELREQTQLLEDIRNNQILRSENTTQSQTPMSTRKRGM